MLERRNRPQVDVDCSGPPREIGAALGAGLQEKIIQAKELLPELESFRLGQPWWMPYPWFQQYAEQQARQLLEPALRAQLPLTAERLQGMADGADVSLNTLYLFHALESLFVSLACSSATSPIAACTAVGIPATRATTGRPIIAHNFDGVTQLAPLLSLRRQKVNGSYGQMSFAAAPLAGVVDGLNEHGLCVTYNWIFATDEASPAPPISLAIDDALNQCRTVSEAVHRVASMPRCGGGMLMMADADGDLAALELSNKRHHVRRPKDGQAILWHSNQFRSSRMRDVQPSHEATFSQYAPRELRGRRVRESAEFRDKRLASLLASQERIGPNELLEIMADHGAEGHPDANTICMHGRHWVTTAALHLYPMDRSICVSYGPACEAKLETFTL